MSAFRLSLRSFVAFAGTLVLVVGTANSGEAAPGDLDPTFDFDGKVRTDFGGGGDEPLAVAIQPDGKILAAGSTDSASAGTEANFAVARYGPDGALDPLFGGNGKVITSFGPSGAGARALAIQGDGKVLMAGGAWGLSPDGGESFALARYNPDGSLDPTFGGDGRVVTDGETS